MASRGDKVVIALAAIEQAVVAGRGHVVVAAKAVQDGTAAAGADPDLLWECTGALPQKRERPFGASAKHSDQPERTAAAIDAVADLLKERPWSFLVAAYDCVRRHICQRLHVQGGVEAANGRVGRATSDEQVGDVPALAVTVDH
jgi:hypothetical protein